MGNTQGPIRRDRADSGGNNRPRSYADDECPVQLKIAKVGGLHGFMDTGDLSYSASDSNEYPVVVKWTGDAKNVYVTGSWNNWKNKIPLVKSRDDFTTIINLPEGRHEYKFSVDGNWTCDNTLPKTSNGMGGENNVIVIDQGDFEVFDALDKDLASSTGAGNTGTGANGATATAAGGANAEMTFTQDIPDRKAFESGPQPPILPPHLLQVILNKDTPVHCDPNVLPEPNHVMLNHLYALSIKEGVMVLSATHRYRKKYVTTLLYKPI